MELVLLYKGVIGLDVHQAQITACAIVEDVGGVTRVEQRQFDAFKRDRHALAAWAQALGPELVVMDRRGHAAGRNRHGYGRLLQRRPARVLGRHLSGEQRVRRQTPIRTYPERQYLRALAAVRIRPRRQSYGIRFKSKFQALTIRRGHKRAIVAIGHKILRTIFHMLARATHFRDSTLDYEALAVARNAPRWIKSLKRFGFLPDPV